MIYNRISMEVQLFTVHIQGEYSENMFVIHGPGIIMKYGTNTLIYGKITAYKRLFTVKLR